MYIYICIYLHARVWQIGTPSILSLVNRKATRLDKAADADIYIKTGHVLVATVVADAVVCNALHIACSYSQCSTRCCRRTEIKT